MKSLWKRLVNRMKLSNRLRGMGHVFRFSVQQHYAMMGVKILLLILFAVSVAAFPVARMFTDSGDSDNIMAESTDVTMLYLRNETGIPFDTAYFQQGVYKGIEVIETESSNETFGQLVAESRSCMAVAASLESKTGITVEGFYAAGSELAEYDVDSVTAAVAETLRHGMLSLSGIDDSKLEMLNGDISMKVSDLSDYHPDEDKNGVDTSTHGMVSLYYSMLVMMMGSLAMGYIFQLCVDEKSSKLVELLMVSIAPAALLFGKILAVTLFIAAGIALILIGLCISFAIAKATGSTQFIQDLLDSMSLTSIMEEVGIGTLLIMLISVFIGYATLALLCAIPAACCSKNEDIQTVSIYTVLFIMLGYLAGAFVPLFESPAADTFFSLCPYFSVFMAPANYICGKLSLPLLIVSWIISIAFMFVLLMIADKVYHMMILHRGAPPKLNDLIRMWKQDKAVKEVPHEKA